MSIIKLIFSVVVLSAMAQVQEADLIGEWYKSKMSTVDFVNPATGAHANPSGERLNVRFQSDGTFKLGWLKQSSLYNCSSTVFGYKVGAYTLSNSVITMQVKNNTLTSKDNCHPQWNYEKHPPLGTTSYQLRLGRSQYGPVLIMRGPDGKEEVYARETGKPLLGD
jgi:hypothetical protein